MKSSAIILFFLVCGHTIYAGEGEYAVSKIPSRILKGANAVVRLDERSVEIKSLEKVVIRDRFVITIFNEEGDRYAGLTEVYDKFRSIESINGTLYDALGNKIKSLKKNDIKDISVTSEANLADDGRMKFYNFYYKVYPYTVEYETETVNTETMFLPSWAVVPGEKVGVERSVISIATPENYDLRYKTYNINLKPVKKIHDGRSVYTWEFINIEPVVREFASPGWHEITPFLMIAPSEFMIEDYHGQMKDWKEMGLFQVSLNKGRDVLPEQTRNKVMELTRGVTGTREKIAILYDYLQNTTRYVSIQLGIGGWRPFDANFVASKGYGDCKALSNYMYSLLKEAGIPSYYTLVKAGSDEEDLVTDFPSRQFNHVILCVPLEKDTMWLECTSQTTPPGYMGSFTGNRHALLITEQGGKLVKTPTYGINENTQVRKIQAVLEGEGLLSVNAETLYKGIQQDELHSLIHHLSKDKVKEYLQTQLDFPTYEVGKFEYNEESKSIPCIQEKLEVEVFNYATITSKRLFITPNIMSRSSRKLSTDTARKYEIVLGPGFRDIDSVEIIIPGGYEPEAIPADIKVTTKFGSYTASVKLNGEKLVYFRNYEHYAGRFAAKDYNELVKFYETIHKADRNKVVLVKKAP
ncbi:MAG TPA: DUF3857 domain-containing protein [Chitinophagaceae bacterium]|nr:DUF3857 domain-containing protein [Chitinophagaceae bacterium]